MKDDDAMKFLKIFPKIKRIKFIGSGFRYFPTEEHWAQLGGLVRRSRREDTLRLEDIDVSQMLWGAHCGLPGVIKQTIENIHNYHDLNGNI